jgi:hypothetical protein
MMIIYNIKTNKIECEYHHPDYAYELSFAALTSNFVTMLCDDTSDANYPNSPVGILVALYRNAEAATWTLVGTTTTGPNALVPSRFFHGRREKCNC